MNKKIKLNTQKNIFKIIFSIKIAVVLTFFVIYEMLLVTHINEKGYGRFSLRIKDTGCGLKSTRPKTVEIQDIEQGEKEKMLIYHTTYRE